MFVFKYVLFSSSNQIHKFCYINAGIMDHRNELFKIRYLFNMFQFLKHILWEINTSYFSLWLTTLINNNNNINQSLFVIPVCLTCIVLNFSLSSYKIA